MYLEYDCQHCGFEFLSIKTVLEARYKAQVECENCGEYNEVDIMIKITAVGLPLKED